MEQLRLPLILRTWAGERCGSSALRSSTTSRSAWCTKRFGRFAASSHAIASSKSSSSGSSSDSSESPSPLSPSTSSLSPLPPMALTPESAFPDGRFRFADYQVEPGGARLIAVPLRPRPHTTGRLAQL